MHGGGVGGAWEAEHTQLQQWRPLRDWRGWTVQKHPIPSDKGSKETLARGA